jgi:glyoxylase-like metal-dependent hydrolase (beta-lactamase superfamily II)
MKWKMANGNWQMANRFFIYHFSSSIEASLEGNMRIAPGVEMLELSAMLMNGPGILCPTLIWDEKEAVLVDAGLPGMARQFMDAIVNAGVQPEKLTGIIITHHDLDHIGSLGELQRMMPHHVRIMAHPDEVPYIQGERRPIKMTPEMMAKMEEQMKAVPQEQRQAMKGMMESMRNQKITIDRELVDGETLPSCGGIQIIHTPGHTPGHICLYLHASRILIAGDSLFVEEGKLSPAPAFINADTSLALQSLKKLTRCDVAGVIAYHGGLFRDAPNARIAEICSQSQAGA